MEAGNVGTRSQIEMSLLVCFFFLKKKKKNFKYSLWFLLDLTSGFYLISKGEKLKHPKNRSLKKTKLRATLYHNHKRRTEEEVVRLFIAAIRIEVDAIPVNVGIYVQPFEDNISKGEKKFSLPWNCDEDLLLFRVDTSKLGKCNFLSHTHTHTYT